VLRLAANAAPTVHGGLSPHLLITMTLDTLRTVGPVPGTGADDGGDGGGDGGGAPGSAAAADPRAAEHPALFGATDPTQAGTTTRSVGESGGANRQLTTEQRTQAVRVLRGVTIQPVPQSVTIAVGQPVPTTVTQLVECPATLESLITGIRDCKVVRVGNQYYIVEGGSRQVVTVIESP
jgi:hypothetical protein